MTSLARRSTLLQYGLLIAVLVAAGYGEGLRVPFHWDDFDVVLPHRALKSLDNVPEFFRPGYWVSTESPRMRPYRPVREVYFALMVGLFDDQPAGWHATALGLHLLNSLLLLAFLQLLLGRSALAGCAAALFAAHPAHVESVVWVKNAGELLAFLFAMVSMVLFVATWREGPRRRTWRAAAYVASLAAFGAGLCAKESVSVLPLLLALLLILDRRRSLAGPRRWVWASLAPYFLAVSVYALMQLGALSAGPANFSIAASSKRSPEVRLAHAVLTTWRYAAILALPVEDHAWRSPLPEPPHVPWTKALAEATAGVAVVLVVIWLSVVRKAGGWKLEAGGMAAAAMPPDPESKTQDPECPPPTSPQSGSRDPQSGRFSIPAFAILWTLLSLAPVANLVAYNSGRPVAEQRAYFPSAGWCLLLAVGFAGLRRKGSLLLAALLLVFTGLTANDVHAWRTPLSLWERSIRLSPDVAGARCNLGNAYSAMQRPELASAEYHAAARLSPGDPQVLNNLAVGLERDGDLQGAMASYRAALASSPRYAKARYNLAQLLIRLGRPDEAMQELDRLLRDRPDYVPALVSRGDLLGRQGRLDEAVGVLRQALRASPDHVDALFMLGRACYLARSFDDAEAAYRRLIELRPDLAQAHSGLGLVLAARGRLPEAVRHLQQAANLDPGLIEPRRALAGIAAREDRHEPAAALYAECAAIAQRQGLPPAERAELLRLQARELNYAKKGAEAREVWRALLRLAPGDAEATRALQTDDAP